MNTNTTVYFYLGIIGAVALALIMIVTSVSSPTSSVPSIVMILNTEETGVGTGFVTNTLQGKRVIVTNDHVCAVQAGGTVRVKADGGRVYVKRILARDALRDLCVVEGISAPALPIASDSPVRFDRIAVVGHPLLEPAQPTSGLYIGDVVSSFFKQVPESGECASGAKRQLTTLFGVINVCQVDMDLSITNVPIFHGSSGSPVFNTKGEIVGVVNSTDSRNNHGRFIPLPYLKDILAR